MQVHYLIPEGGSRNLGHIAGEGYLGVSLPKLNARFVDRKCMQVPYFLDATRSRVFIERNFSSTVCKGSNGSCCSALREGRHGLPRQVEAVLGHNCIATDLSTGRISVYPLAVENGEGGGASRPVSGSKRCHPCTSGEEWHQGRHLWIRLGPCHCPGAPKDTASMILVEGPARSFGSSTGCRVLEE